MRTAIEVLQEAMEEYAREYHENELRKIDEAEVEAISIQQGESDFFDLVDLIEL